MHISQYEKNRYRQGQLLMEALLAVSAAIIVLALGAQLIYVSLRSGQVASDRNIGLGLVEEGLSAVGNSATEQWQYIYTLAKNGIHYHPVASSGAWTVAAGDEVIAVGEKTFTRYFTIANVCRDTVTRDITGLSDGNGATMLCTGSGGAFDPSTQSVSMVVQLPDGGDILRMDQYLLRWRNRACVQSSWSGGAAAGVAACATPTYASKANIVAGETLELTPQ